MTTIDQTDTKRALAHHNSGAEYIVEYASVWDDQTCVGSQIVRSCGPITREADLDGLDNDQAVALFDLIDRTEWEWTDEDAAWLQGEEDAGRLAYPIGAR